MYFEGDPLIKQCPIVRTINNDDAVRRTLLDQRVAFEIHLGDQALGPGVA
jgi:protocatechuate 3,4-dioxygenase beta subunit